MGNSWSGNNNIYYTSCVSGASLFPNFFFLFFCSLPVVQSHWDFHYLLDIWSIILNISLYNSDFIELIQGVLVWLLVNYFIVSNATVCSHPHKLNSVCRSVILLSIYWVVSYNGFVDSREVRALRVKGH